MPHAFGDGLSLDESELEWRFVHASGPGGQNVNKVATAVQLRFDAEASPSLPEPVKQRLRRLAGRRLTSEGMLVIDARRFRSQQRNREDALARLLTLLDKAARPPRKRRPTRPTRASVERRLESKIQRARVKRARRPVRNED